MGGRERGSVLPLLALIMVLVGVVSLALGRIGGAAAESARARTAADAAALAGAAEGRDAAAALAGANGGRLVTYEQHGSDTRVVVAVGSAEATSRARRENIGGGR